MTTPSERVAAASFAELYRSARGELHRALATVTDDRDLATEATDAGFTGWRRKLRKPTHIPPDVGVMAVAFKWARKQISKKSAPLSGFRLSEPAGEVDTASLDRFKRLSLDERGLLVMRLVLGWNDSEISHAISADGIGAASQALIARLEADGYDEDRIAGALQTRAATFVEPLSRLEAVKAKGTAQKIATLGASAALAAATIVGATVVIGNTDPSAEQPSGATTPPGGAGSSGMLTAENAVWQEVPMPVDGSNVTSVVHDGTAFYLLGMSDRGNPQIMKSATGLDWETVPAPPGGQNIWLQHMAATPGVIVVVGGGFDERRGQESTFVYISEDRETWSRVDLSSANSIEIAGRFVNLHSWVDSVDVSDSGFTIVGQQMAEFDPEELLRDVIDPELLRHGYGSDNQGMQFYDNQGRIIETLSWEELDVDPDLISLISGERMIIWTSEDGIEWAESEVTGPSGAQGIGALATIGDVDVALAHGRFGPSMWLKTDGEWARADVDFQPTALTTWDDQLVVAGADKADGRPGVWRTTDGVTWDQSEVPGAVINRILPSGDGLVALGYGEDAPGMALGPAEIEAGDFTVLASSDGKFEVIDSDGNLVIEVYQEDVTSGEQITISHPETGEIVAEFDDLAYEQAWEAVYREADFGDRSGPPQATILLSDDGVTWTSLPLEDPDFQPGSVAVGNGSLLLVGWSGSSGLLGLSGPRPQLFLVQPG